MDSEQIKAERAALYANFALDEHKIREGYTSYGQITWFVYVDSEPIQARLDDLFFMEWELTYPDHANIQDDYVSIAATIKIRGMAKTGAGGQGLNGQPKVNEDTVKGAYTDAFKRAAAKWGIAMYLTVAPKFMTNTYTKGAWEMREFRQAEAWAQFVAWYQNTPYVSPVMPNQQRPSATQEPAASKPATNGNGHSEPPAATPPMNKVATNANAFPDVESAKKFAKLWEATKLNKDDILAALGVNALGAYQGTLAEAKAAVDKFRLDKAVTF